MKKYILHIVSAVLLISFNGCYDLDRFPDNQLSAGTFWKTREHADQAMAGVYSMLHDDNVFGTVFGLDCLGSVASGYDGPSYANTGRGTYTATDGGVVGKWTALYEGVARANLVIQNVGRVDMSDDLKTQYVAEARFMRALFYNELLNFYGGVPLYDESWVVAEKFNDMKEPRSSAAQVREFILKDLDAAIASLPEEGARSASDYGRATKGAAQALKGKVYLFNRQYQEAATLFEAVCSSGKYALYPNYGNLFKPGGDASNEMIFAVQNLGGIGLDYGMPTTFYMGSRSSFGSCWDNVTAATDFVDSYEYKNGKPFSWEDWFPGFTTDNAVKEKTFLATLSSDKKTVSAYPEAKNKLLAMYEQRDPRMQASLILPYTMYKGWVSNAPKDCEYVVAVGVHESNGFVRVNNNWYIYLWRKFVAEYDMNGMINNRADTPINFPLIRYADVLLMLAECYNEMGKQADAVALINEVRARVDMPGLNSGPAWLAANSKDEVFERIRHERAVELAAEGHSFNDYKRWSLLQTLHREMKGFTGRVYYNRVVRDRDYLWPVPDTERDKNKLLEQNPGW
ncbi:MAG: RagB/SusD family nutrient uptake outer membrane protein [Tannerella sp.]|jgi:tetratricopeptide (TPR) repeat protein|nr:RagB/SusD family nutrient uptake outer membrane protein [Tannerella sp.]